MPSFVIFITTGRVDTPVITIIEEDPGCSPCSGSLGWKVTGAGSDPACPLVSCCGLSSCLSLQRDMVHLAGPPLMPGTELSKEVWRTLDDLFLSPCPHYQCMRRLLPIFHSPSVFNTYQWKWHRVLEPTKMCLTPGLELFPKFI